MASLQDILNDPNYTSANEATKRAIFERWAPQDPNYAQANPATQAAIRARFGLQEPAAAQEQSAQQPQRAQLRDLPAEVGRSLARQTRDIAGGAIRGAGSIGSALVEAGRTEPAGIGPATPGTFMERVRQRSGDVKAGLETLGVDTESLAFGAAKLGTEVAGTMGAGPLLAAGARALNAPRAASALQTGGLGAEGAGGLTGAAGAATRVGAGGTVGLGTGVLTDPDQAAAATGIGAALPVGGRLIEPTGKLLSKLWSSKNQRAANIARQSLGGDIDQVRQILANAPPGASVAELTVGIQNPVWQALVEKALRFDSQFVLKMKDASEEQARSKLASLVGGATETDIRRGLDLAKQNLNKMTGPMREAALDRANLGKDLAEYEARAGRLSKEAAAEVQEVRDLISAGQAAEAWARLDLIKRGLPVGATKYTHFGELADKAFNEWSNKAASASLDLGQGARFAKAAADALRANGIQPLTTAPLVQSLQRVTQNPRYAGNDLIENSISDLAQGLQKWTDGGGVIDARALDAIRKNSVNATIARLRPGIDATSQRNLAAGVLSKIKPAIDDAIEEAGGTGYREYLRTHAEGMQRLAERELTGRAAKMWNEGRRDDFVRLVMGNSPDEVEKILGPGKYDIARELSERTMDVLRDQARQHLARTTAASQAAEPGAKEALERVLEQNLNLIRLPNRLRLWIANTNTALDLLERQVGPGTLKRLTEAMKTPQGAADLLNTLPVRERARIVQLLNDPMGTKRSLGRAAAIAALPESEPQEQP